MVDSRVLEVIVVAAVLLQAAGEDALKAHFPEASHREGRGAVWLLRRQEWRW